MDQLEERILQTDQLKNASKRLQHRVDHIPGLPQLGLENSLLLVDVTRFTNRRA